MKKVLETLSVAIGVILVFLVQNSELSKYSNYLLAILIVFAGIYLSFKGREESSIRFISGRPTELFLISSIVVFIISLTGGLNSSLFFFLYFMFFLLAFISRAFNIWVFLASIIVFFLPQASNSFSMEVFIRLLSLVLIAPIAYFIGNEFERRSNLIKRIRAKSDEIIDDAKNLKESADDKEELDTLDEIIEEADSLKEDAKR